MDDLIISVEFSPENERDSRCLGWCKLIRADDKLRVTPAECAADIDAPYLRGGVTLYPGDAVIFTEQVHHRKQRGWFGRLYYCTQEGELISMRDCADHKQKIKEFLIAIKIDKETYKNIMGGTGHCAAVYRYLMAIRLGMDVGNFYTA